MSFPWKQESIAGIPRREIATAVHSFHSGMKKIFKNPEEEIEEEIKDIVFHFLSPQEYQLFIFGSRATGKAQKYSDYDVGIFGKNQVSWSKIVLIEEALEESDLPYKVDIVDFSLVSANFKKVALSKIRKL